MNPQNPQNQSLPIDIIKNNELIIGEELIKKINVPRENIHIFIGNSVLTKIGKFNSLKEDEMLLDLLKKWKVYSGINQVILKEEWIINLDFVKKNFPRLNLWDIDMTINLSTANKLTIKKTDESFAIFSPAFIGRFLSAYEAEYKPIVISDIKEKMQRIEQSDKNSKKYSDEENLKSFKKIIESIYHQIKTDQDFFDYSNWVFNYLYYNSFIPVSENKGKITIEKSLLLESKKWAFEKIKSLSENKGENSFIEALNSIKRLDKKNNEIPPEKILQYQKKYMIIYVLKSIENIADFLKEVTIEKMKLSEE